MKHDMFAAFYEKANDKKPVYRCPLGIFCAPTFNFFKDNGFIKDKNATQGYLDYVKETDVQEIQKWVQADYVSEVMDVLYSGKDFEKIVLQAEELDILDDDGMVPVRGLPICESFVKFSGTEPMSPVTFIDGDPYSMTENTRKFSIPLKKLKDYFDVLTMMEVMERMEEFKNGNHWRYEQLKEYFESGIDDAVDLATRIFFGKRDLDGNPEILHALSVGMAGRNKTEMIVGFLHDVVEDSSVTLEDLTQWGYSEEVVNAVNLLTHRKGIPYMGYIDNIIQSGNPVAIAVKMNDLRHNIARGEAGGHNELVAKHKAALEMFTEVIISKSENNEE